MVVIIGNDHDFIGIAIGIGSPMPIPIAIGIGTHLQARAPHMQWSRAIDTGVTKPTGAKFSITKSRSGGRIKKVTSCILSSRGCGSNRKGDYGVDVVLFRPATAFAAAAPIWWPRSQESHI